MQAYDDVAKHLRTALDNLGDALDILEDTDLAHEADVLEIMYENLRVVYRQVKNTGRVL